MEDTAMRTVHTTTASSNELIPFINQAVDFENQVSRALYLSVRRMVEVGIKDEWSFDGKVYRRCENFHRQGPPC